MIQPLVQFAATTSFSVETEFVGAFVRHDFGQGVHDRLRERGLKVAPVIAKGAPVTGARWFLQVSEFDAVGPVTWREVMTAAGIEV